MTLDEIMNEWKTKDSIIEMNALDVSSVETTKLHAKYLELYSTYRLKLKDAEWKQKDLMKWKYLYYEGKLSKEDIDRFGWAYDPYEGLSATTNKFKEHFIETDKELVESEKRIQYLTTTIDTLKDILENLKWRHQTIRNTIEWKKFEAGF